MKTRSGRGKFRNFQILLDRSSNLTIVMVNLTSQLKEKLTVVTMWGIKSRKFTTLKKENIEFCLL